MKNVQEAEKLGREHAQSLRKNLNSYIFQGVTPMENHHDIPYFDYCYLRAKCGEVTQDMERAYRKAFNQELKK